MTETGSQVTLYSGLNANDTTGGFVAFLTLGSQIVTYPTADYKIDDSPGESSAKSTICQSTYLILRHSQPSKTIRGLRRKNNLPPDANYDRRHSQD